jgi:predicted negative regulator of RcsB-dependent stress response
MTKVFLSTRKLDGSTYIDVYDLVNALKLRADEYEREAAKYNPQNPHQAYDNYAHLFVAKELRERADILAFATFAYNEQEQDTKDEADNE